MPRGQPRDCIPRSSDWYIRPTPQLDVEQRSPIPPLPSALRVEMHLGPTNLARPAILPVLHPPRAMTDVQSRSRGGSGRAKRAHPLRNYENGRGRPHTSRSCAPCSRTTHAALRTEAHLGIVGRLEATAYRRRPCPSAPSRSTVVLAREVHTPHVVQRGCRRPVVASRPC